jgi:hypothetical protein
MQRVGKLNQVETEPGDEQYEKISLEKTVRQLEEEARMVLPGIQALFGFQLIAVFNQRFTQLSAGQQNLHFISLVCSALAILLVLTPAAYHRQVEPDTVSRFFCRLGSVMLTLSMLPLAAGVCLDLFVIAAFVYPGRPVANVCLILAGLAFLSAWFAFPQLMLFRKRGKHASLARR